MWSLQIRFGNWPWDPGDDHFKLEKPIEELCKFLV